MQRSMVNFERCCLGIFLTNVLIIFAKTLLFLIPPSILAYRHGHLLTHFMINIFVMVLLGLVMGTFVGIPYWLALFVSRKKSQIAKYLFYGAGFMVLSDTIVFTMLHGFFTWWTLPVAFDFIAMIFAAMLLPSSNSGEWARYSAKYRL